MKRAPAHEPDPETVDSLALATILKGRSPKRRAKLCATITDAIDETEQRVMRRAGVYPIRGGGAAYGERAEDREALAACRLLRAALARSR